MDLDLDEILLNVQCVQNAFNLINSCGLAHEYASDEEVRMNE